MRSSSLSVDDDAFVLEDVQNNRWLRHENGSMNLITLMFYFYRAKVGDGPWHILCYMRLDNCSGEACGGA